MKRNWKKNLIGLLILSQLGSGVLSFILSWYVLEVTNSALSFSSVVIPTSIVGLVVAYPIGKVVDKYSKNRLMVLAQLMSILSLVIFGLFRYTHGDAYLSVSIITLNVCLSVCDEFISTSLLAAAQQIVNSEDELGSYNSLSQTIRSICSMTAPLLGAALYHLFSLTTFVIIEIVIEAICVFYIYNIKLVNEVEVQEETETVKSDLSIGDMVNYLLSRKIIVHLSICMLFLNLLMGSLNVGYPFIVSENFKDKPYIFGFISFVIPLGMLSASILYQILRLKSRLVKQAVYSWSGFAAVIVLIGVSTYYLDLKSYLFAFIMILSSFIVGFLASFSQIPTMTFMQKVVPAKLQGRIFSLLDSFVKAAVPVSYLLYGVLFDKFNLSLIFMLSGILVLLYMLFMIIYSNKVKE